MNITLKESTEFKKWRRKYLSIGESRQDIAGWNGAINRVIGILKHRHKQFQGHWQHEDIEILIEYLKIMKVKKLC